MRVAVATLALFLAACSSEAQDTQVAEPVVPTPQLKSETVQVPQIDMPELELENTNPLGFGDRSPPTDYAPPPLPECSDSMVAGGMMLCTTEPNASIRFGDIKTVSDAEGKFIIGFDRDTSGQKEFTVRFPENSKFSGQIAVLKFDVKPRDWDISRIDGLPKNQVSEYTPEELKRIRAATARKKVGFASRVDTVRLTEAGFASPVADYTKTTNFGAQRILNGIEKRPHYGVDMAAPAGTAITAPAGGVVSLADDDMYFEGSLIMIDHGQGLISYYLHMQDVLVEDGQIVATGDLIGTVGSKGRSTGPHLCWRLKWRGQNLDPELLTKWADK